MPNGMIIPVLPQAPTPGIPVPNVPSAVPPTVSPEYHAPAITKPSPTTLKAVKSVPVFGRPGVVVQARATPPLSCRPPYDAIGKPRCVATTPSTPSTIVKLGPFPKLVPKPTPMPLLTIPTCPEGGSYDLEAGACVSTPIVPSESVAVPGGLPTFCPEGTSLRTAPGALVPECLPCEEGSSWVSSPPFNACAPPKAAAAGGKKVWPWLLGGALVLAGAGALYYARKS